MQANEIKGAYRKRVIILGATGTIGRATVGALVRKGHDVVCLIRPPPLLSVARPRDSSDGAFQGASIRFVDVTDRVSLLREGFRDERFDAMISCLASRTGAPTDAWTIDYRAHIAALAAAKDAGVIQVALLSAICVQRPRLAFQHAKLAFEKVLRESGLTYSIVRPTAYFKSLSGQVERVRKGKPFMVFGDGTLTACKPISNNDLAEYIADCLDDDTRHNRILPVGGPGDAITPLQQGEELFRLLGRRSKFRHVPVAVLDTIVAALAAGGRMSSKLAEKAELARIGRYYATESMLVLNSVTGRYDAAATPSTGSDTLFDYYARLIDGTAVAERGDHAVF